MRNSASPASQPARTRASAEALCCSTEGCCLLTDACQYSSAQVSAVAQAAINQSASRRKCMSGRSAKSTKSCLVGAEKSAKSCLVGAEKSAKACLVGAVKSAKACLVGAEKSAKACLVGKSRPCLVGKTHVWLENPTHVWSGGGVPVRARAPWRCVSSPPGQGSGAPNTVFAALFNPDQT